MRRPDFSSLMLPLALVAACTLVVLLGRQSSSLRADLAREREKSVAMQRGMFVPSFQAPAVDGSTRTLVDGAPGRKQVLFVYNTRCPYCEQNVPTWKALATRLAADSAVEVLGVSLDSAEVTRAYADRHGLTYPSVLLHPRNLIGMYRADVVPQTLVVDGEGLVVHARLGVLNTPAAIDSVVEATRWQRPPPPAAGPAPPAAAPTGR